MVLTPDNIYCPLCEDRMTKREISLHGKRATLYFCKKTGCEIGTYDFDPAFNRWRDADKAVPCPTCGAPLKWFARYMDGFFKGFCPRCKTTLKKDGDIRFDKGNIIVAEDVDDDPVETPVEVKIPLNHFQKLGKDKINAIHNKLRRQKG